MTELQLTKQHSQVKGYARFERWLKRQHVSVQMVYKTLIALVGIAIVSGGLLLVPLPGPGWLIVFLGLAVLGLEFPKAKQLNAFAKRKVKEFIAWAKVKKDTRSARKIS